jgi:hypothetical protein
MNKSISEDIQDNGIMEFRLQLELVYTTLIKAGFSIMAMQASDCLYDIRLGKSLVALPEEIDLEQITASIESLSVSLQFNLVVDEIEKSLFVGPSTWLDVKLHYLRK